MKTFRQTGIAALVLGFLFALPALPATLNVTWSHPTTYVDGAALPVSDILHTRLEYGDCNAAGTAIATVQGQTQVLAPAAAVQLTVAGFGPKCVRGFTRVTAAAGGAESAASNVAARDVPPPVPNAPVFATNAITLVYDLRFTKDGEARLANAVGSVPANTACGDLSIVQTRRRDFHEVSADLVSFYKAPNSAIVVADCAPVQAG